MSDSASAPAAIPFVKDFAFEYGASAQLSPLVRRVIANNPGPFTYTGSGTYIVGAQKRVAVIDPGPEDDSHFSALVRAVEGATVSHILVTHTHRDHCAGARRLADAVKIPILASSAHPVRDKTLDAPALDEGADYDFAPDQIIADGAVVTGDGWTIEAVSTPGHLSNHFCFGLIEEKALFTGDHVMGWATTVVAPPDGDMAAYLQSLDKLLARDDAVYYPTHGAPIANPKPFVRAIKTHRLMRDGQILQQLRSGKTRIREIVAAIYAGVDKRLHGAAALNVFAHLIRLVAAGAVETDGAPDLRGEYRVR
jgi:glyoxylase-like metal-dependent hydrolase (beta-lactamase superfamily II)